MPILLLEGINCCGKSTLAARLAEDTGLEIVKFSMPPTQGTFDYFWDALQAAHTRHPHFIVDRCHLSNAVYGSIQGGGLLNPHEWRLIDDWFAKQEAWLFLMTDDVFQVENRVYVRGREIDQPLGREQLADLQRKFEEVYRESEIVMKGQFSLRQFFEFDVNSMLCTDQPMAQYESILATFNEKMAAP